MPAISRMKNSISAWQHFTVGLSDRIRLYRNFLCVLICQAAVPSSPLIADEPHATRDCWAMQDSGVTTSLRGLCAVSHQVCWASGSGGTVLKTVDGGDTWMSTAPAGCSTIDFRDIHAWNALEAVIMTAGDPDRLYRTSDGGQTWTVVFELVNPAAFFDGITFTADGRSGWLMGDPTDGRLFLATTADGGRTWKIPDPDQLPRVPDGIAGFAASGTNLCVTSPGRVIIGLGGVHAPDNDPRALVCSTSDSGSTWQFARLPMRASASAGVFSVTALDAAGNRLVAVGGDYLQPNAAGDNVALSDNAGRDWRLPKTSSSGGFRSAVAATRRLDDTLLLVTVGPSGTEVSADAGESWSAVSSTGFHAVSFTQRGDGWGAGSDGRIALWNDE